MYVYIDLDRDRYSTQLTIVLSLFSGDKVATFQGKRRKRMPEMYVQVYCLFSLHHMYCYYQYVQIFAAAFIYHTGKRLTFLITLRPFIKL